LATFPKHFSLFFTKQQQQQQKNLTDGRPGGSSICVCMYRMCVTPGKVVSWSHQDRGKAAAWVML